MTLACQGSGIEASLAVAFIRHRNRHSRMYSGISMPYLPENAATGIVVEFEIRALRTKYEKGLYKVIAIVIDFHVIRMCHPGCFKGSG